MKDLHHIKASPPELLRNFFGASLTLRWRRCWSSRWLLGRCSDQRAPHDLVCNIVQREASPPGNEGSVGCCGRRTRAAVKELCGPAESFACRVANRRPKTRVDAGDAAAWSTESASPV